MLIPYFLKNFLQRSLVFFAILTSIFASCNLFIRLPFIRDHSSIPLIIITMLPVVTVFSLPLSSMLAVATTIAQHTAYNECLIFALLKPTRQALLRAIVIFSVLCTIVYACVVFQFAPQSYHKGKQLLFKIAQEQLLKLEPNKFHTPFSSFTFFFKKKENIAKDTQRFTTLFLVLWPKRNKDERFFFTAQQGILKREMLSLYNGSIYTSKHNRFHTATFTQTDIDIHRLIETEKGRPQLTNLKFQTWDRLWRLRNTEKESLLEFHKRIAQSLWQLALPVLAFILMSIGGFVSFLSSILTCGVLYLFSYICVAYAQSYHDSVGLTLFFLYVPLLVLVLLGFGVYRKRLF